MNCPNCGKPSEGDLPFCTECGTRLDKLNEHATETQSSSVQIEAEQQPDYTTGAETDGAYSPQPSQPSKPYVNTAALAGNTKKQKNTAAKGKKRSIAPCKPISTWGYVWRSILFAIPLIGIIALFVFAFSEGINDNSRAYARCWLIFLLLLAIAVVAFIVVWYFYAPEIVDWLQNFVSSLQTMIA